MTKHKWGQRLAIALLLVWFLLFAFGTLTTVVNAQEMRKEEHVVLQASQVVNDNYFAAGEAVTVSGTVNGDAYLAGGKITVDGTINGDLLAAGGDITIRGTVTQDVRVVGGQVTVLGQIGGNLTAGAGDVMVADRGEVAGSLVAGVGNLELYGPLGKSATIGAGQATLGNEVGGNILAGVGNLSLAPGSNIQGNLTYYSEDQANVSPEATVAGKVLYQKPPAETTQKDEGSLAVGYLIWRVLNLVTWFIIGVVLLRLAPMYMAQTVSTLAKSPLTNLGVGFLTLIVTPVVTVLLLMTVVGIPFGLGLFVLYCIELYLAKIMVSLWAGQKILGYYSKKYAMWQALLLGLIAYSIAIMIPVIGWLLWIVALLTGLGALVVQKRAYYKALRSKKLL